jgi:hypothetical protein
MENVPPIIPPAQESESADESLDDHTHQERGNLDPEGFGQMHFERTGTSLI